jgi:hypothetical protein
MHEQAKRVKQEEEERQLKTMFQPKIKKMKVLPSSVLQRYNYRGVNHSTHVIPIDNADTR